MSERQEAAQIPRLDRFPVSGCATRISERRLELVAGNPWVRTQGQDRMGAVDKAEAGNICKERPLEAADICMS
jgi:hypothetical protein